MLKIDVSSHPPSSRNQRTPPILNGKVYSKSYCHKSDELFTLYLEEKEAIELLLSHSPSEVMNINYAEFDIRQIGKLILKYRFNFQLRDKRGPYHLFHIDGKLSDWTESFTYTNL